MSKNKEQVDEFTYMDITKLQEYIATQSQILRDSRSKRNFVQQEQDMINSLYQISKEEQKKIEDAIEKEDIVMEELEKNHRYEINAFNNKFRHLEYDHEVFINDQLPKFAAESVDNEEENRTEREDHFMKKKTTLKNELRSNMENHRREIQNEKMKLEATYQATNSDLEGRLRDIVEKYKKKMKQLEADLELRLKVDIHELEERKNLHLNNLQTAFDDRMNKWKAENISQIKESIKIIKENMDTLKEIQKDNENLEKENEALQKEINELEKQYDEAKKEDDGVKNRLAKYYNQEINMKNMNVMIKALKEKQEDTLKKTSEILHRKDQLTQEITDLKNKFLQVVEQYKGKTEHRNDMLDQHILQLNEDYTKREIEIEDILKNFDIVAGRESMNSNSGNQVGSNNQSGGGVTFGREMVTDLMEHIRTVLSTKTKIIKSLKSSLALATKAYNDTIRVYESKLGQFGLPPEELGFQILETNTSKMPAGLVSD